MGLADISFKDKQKLFKDSQIEEFSAKKRKGAPKVASAYKPIDTDNFRDIVQLKTKAFRDPRFDDLSGSIDQRSFDKDFSFLTEKMQEELDSAREELASLKKKNADFEQIRALQEVISDLNAKLTNAKNRKDFEKFKDKVRKAEIDAVSQGKGAYYMTEHQLKKLYKAKQLKEMNESGAITKYNEKKAKKSMGHAGAFGENLRRK